MATALLISVLILQTSSTQMTVNVSGLPEGIEPKMEVTAPDGSKHALTAGQAVTLTQTGGYTVNGETFRRAGQIIDMIYEAAPVKESLKAGEKKSLTLKYAPRGGTGRMWTITTRINEDEDDLTKAQVRSLAQDELMRGGFNTGSRIFDIPSRAGHGSILPSGALVYAGGWDEPHIIRINPSGLGSSGSRTAITDTEPFITTVDTKGNVWVHNHEIARCYPGSAFTKNTLGQPLITLKNDPEADQSISFSNMVFDGDRSMILFGRGWIQRIPASVAAKSGTIQFNALETSTGTINNGALDQEGSLWMSDENGMVFKFARNDDGAFSPNGTEYSVPQSASGLAIDNEGGVWVLIRYTGELLRLAPGGSEFEAKGVFGRGHDERARLILNPPPAWSPMSAAFPKTRLGE